MGAFRLILLAYFVARCLGNSMGLLPTAMLDASYAGDASMARILRHCHLDQGAPDEDHDEVAALPLDDDFVPAPIGAPALEPDTTEPAAPPAMLAPIAVFSDGLFRPPQV